MNYIAYCTKGLEQIVEQEIVSYIKDAHILEVLDKRIVFKTHASFETLVRLRTVDDIGILLASDEEVTALPQLLEIINGLDLRKTRSMLQQVRTLDPQTFSLTISSAKNKLDSKEITRTAAQEISQKYQWEYRAFDHSNFDIRIFIDGSKLFISVRLTPESLHHRSYKTVSKPGSLKATVAAAMVVMVTEGKQNLKVVDNFCGSGTVLCEAFFMGNSVYGGDSDPESVTISQNNLSRLGFDQLDHIKNLDATKITWNSDFFNAAISNLPWDKQIAIGSITDLYRKTLEEYKRILQPEAALCLLVSKPDLLIKHAKHVFPNHQISSYKIGLLGQTPTIVFIKIKI